LVVKIITAIKPIAPVVCNALGAQMLNSKMTVTNEMIVYASNSSVREVEVSTLRVKPITVKACP